jgi:hypothetical protein
MDIRYCPTCGARLPDNSQFCLQCGRELGSFSGATPPTVGGAAPLMNPPVQTKAQIADAKKAEAQKRAKSGGAGTIFGAIVIVGVIMFFLVLNGGHNPLDSLTGTLDDTNYGGGQVTYDIPPTVQFYATSSPYNYSTKVKGISSAIDYTNPTTRNYAVQLAAKYPGTYSITQICQIWDYLYANWKYVSDPGGADYFAPASQSVSNGLCGDCDDFAVTMAAMIESIGGGTRVVCGYAQPAGHAWAEVYLGKEGDTKTDDLLQSVARKYKAPVYCHGDGNGGVWMNLDWSAGHPGAPFFQADNYLVVRPNGAWASGTFQ